jgi:hypothetical protein
MGVHFPNLTDAQISVIVQGTIAYITEQRRRYGSGAFALSSERQHMLQAFFPADVLANTRFTIQENNPVPNPPFYAELPAMGFQPEHLPNFSAMAAITFVDVIVLHQQPDAQLIFHELVHAVHYRQLGLNAFAPLYVRGFLGGGGYDGIPLEISAYQLDARFVANPGHPFSVANEVDRWIREGRF